MNDPQGSSSGETSPGRIIGRYALYDTIAIGGMATVHVGRLLGPVGFARTVAIKRLHPQYAGNPEFVSMFLDEARMCARIRHPNVVPTLDVVATQGELFLVMEYVQGESLSNLVKAVRAQGQAIPWRVAVTIASGALHGLHAAHEARDERGMPMSLVHRDVSPQNILVGIDGMARVVDFGVAKATGRIHTTRDRAVKGKLGYIAYEQMSGGEITRQADVYAAAVVLWEALCCRRLFDGDSEPIVLTKLLTETVAAPSTVAPEIPKELDDIVMKGLSRATADRFRTAREMAHALERLGTVPIGVVGEWVESVAKLALEARASTVAAVENECAPLAEPELDDEPSVVRVAPQLRRSRPPSQRVVLAPLPMENSRRWLIPAIGAVAAVVGAAAWTTLRPAEETLASTAAGGAPAARQPSAAPTVAPPAFAGEPSPAKAPAATAVAVTPPAPTEEPPTAAAPRRDARPAPKPKPDAEPPSQPETRWGLGGRR
jgi:serine/threonine-protein kinase